MYDWGKWTLSAAILQVVGGLYRTVAMETSTAVGGHQFDNAIVDLLLSDFQRWASFRKLCGGILIGGVFFFRQWKADLHGNTRAVHKLRMAAEEAKHTLSSNQTATIHIDSIHEGIDYQYTLTRLMAGLKGILVSSQTLLLKLFLNPSSPSQKFPPSFNTGVDLTVYVQRYSEMAWE